MLIVLPDFSPIPVINISRSFIIKTARFLQLSKIACIQPSKYVLQIMYKLLCMESMKLRKHRIIFKILFLNFLNFNTIISHIRMWSYCKVPKTKDPTWSGSRTVLFTVIHYGFNIHTIYAIFADLVCWLVFFGIQLAWLSSQDLRGGEGLHLGNIFIKKHSFFKNCLNILTFQSSLIECESSKPRTVPWKRYSTIVQYKYTVQ
jgi:hypothetical protein